MGFDYNSRTKLEKEKFEHWEKAHAAGLLKLKLLPAEKELYEEIGKFSSYSNFDFTKIKEWSKKYAEGKRADEGQSLSALMSSRCGTLIPLFVPKQYRNDYLYMVDQYPKFQYTRSMYRPTVRTAELSAHVLSAFGLLQAYRILDMYGVSVSDYIAERMSPELQDFKRNDSFNRDMHMIQFDDIVAARIDAGDEEVIGTVREAFESENNTVIVTTALIRGVLKSKSADLHDLLARFLVAARLQEGVRQAVCENADCGRPEAFLRILRAISENDLLRFSAVKRAVATWTGICNVDAMERITQKVFDGICEAVNDRNAALAMTETDDSVQIITGLWALGFYEVRDAVDRMLEIIRTGSRNSRLTISYYNLGIYNSIYVNAVAMKMLETYPGDFEMAAAFLPTYIPGSDTMVSRAIRDRQGRQVYSMKEENLVFRAITVEDLGMTAEQARAHYVILRDLADSMKKKKIEFSPMIFPWYGASLEKKTLTEKMAVIAYALQDQAIIDEVCVRLVDISDSYYNTRKNYIRILLHDPQTPVQKNALIDYVGDKETFSRGAAYMMLKEMPLSQEDYIRLEGLLRFKNEETRRYVIDLLGRQSGAQLTQCIERLLRSDKEQIRLAGLDMLKNRCEENPEEKAKYKELLLAAIPDSGVLSDKEKVLYGEVAGSEEGGKESAGDILSKDGYGLYDTSAAYELNFPKADLKVLQKYFSLSAKELRGYLDKIRSFLGDHGKMEYRSANGELQLLSNGLYVTSYGYGPIEDKYPFPELWQEIWETIIGKNPQVLFNLYFSRLNGYYADNIVELKDFQKAEHKVFCDADSGFFYVDENGKPYPNSRDYRTILSIIISQQKLALPEEVAKEALLYAIQLPEELRWLKRTPPRYAPIGYQSNAVSSFLRTEKYSSIVTRARSFKSEEEFRKFFPVLHEADRVYEPEKHVPSQGYTNGTNGNLLSMFAYIKAYELGMISEDYLYKTVFDLVDLRFAVGQLGDLFRDRFILATMQELSKYMTVDLEKRTVDTQSRFYQLCCEVYKRLTDLILDVELRRGDTPTVFSPAVSRISQVTGIPRLMEILRALGKDPLDRTTYYSFGSGTSKRECLCHLLKVCWPDEKETAADLGKAVKENRIAKDRLIEIAMYAPQWLDLVEAYLGVDGFKSGCYYFMAHMNERFDDRKKAVIARYTPLTAEELSNGCFDTAWFFEVYEKLGAKMFDSIYKAAKYTADGSKHTRARKYADAALGKVDRDELEKAIADKRNKDLLMSYGLIPMKDKKDALHRFEFLQKFLKESKQFGAQRRQSEALSVQIALKNMATTAGYADDLRLTLAMEAEMAASSAEYFDGVQIGDYSAAITVDAMGHPELELKKGAKVLKSVPAALKKDETFLGIKDFAAKLKAQYSRCAAMFERAMEEEDVYTYAELTELRTNPVTAGILGGLVWALADGSGAGTLEEIDAGKLAGAGAEQGSAGASGTPAVGPETSFVAAHPITLFRLGVLPEYQQKFLARLKEDGFKQPFKQVFREFYLKLEEEIDSYDSRMFAGYQIQPKKTVAALKGRRWVADYEDGLQKIYYKAGIAAAIYALADWFSPADTECPTLEFVSFSDRRTHKALKLSEVPDILFSEVMRDVDLAISVAHAGGVDPETSHSTIEMRKVIFAFNIEMFGLKNVTLEGTHAFINGTMGRYNVQLGSGVVHKEGGGMINILPVHSQHRGKIFLPFIDEDPKTAEIMSKILLLAEDQKIKDPYILDQIRR